MSRPDKFRLRVFVILATAALTSGCMSEGPGTAGLSPKRIPLTQFRQQDQDITGSVPAPTLARREPATASSYPPPSPVEVRAQCWMRYDQINASLDAKTALTQQCVDERLRVPVN